MTVAMRMVRRATNRRAESATERHLGHHRDDTRPGES
jgi:hypothetical protein